MSGKSTVATFWPTVGTVLSFGWRCGLKRALICSSNVVFPALSSPRRRMEYSGWSRQPKSNRDGLFASCHTFFACRVQIERLHQMVHDCFSSLRQAQSRELSWMRSDNQRINRMHRKLRRQRDSLSRRWRGSCLLPFCSSSLPFTSPCKECINIRLSIVQS
jgi:hypothetical protein